MTKRSISTFYSIHFVFIPYFLIENYFKTVLFKDYYFIQTKSNVSLDFTFLKLDLKKL